MHRHAVLGRLIAIKPVASRNAYALTIDVAEEHHDALAELFPLPSVAHAFDVCVFKPSSETQKAVAASAAAASDDAGASEASTPPASRLVTNTPRAGEGERRDRRPWDEIAPAAQIAIACQSPYFREYLARDIDGIRMLDEAGAQDEVKRICGVEQKRDVRLGTDALGKWHELHAAFQTWLKYERAA
jgi:hypothetical protein